MCVASKCDSAVILDLAVEGEGGSGGGAHSYQRSRGGGGGYAVSCARQVRR